MKRVRAIREAFNGLNTNKWVAGDAALAEVPMGRDGDHSGALIEVRRLAHEAGVEFNALRDYRNVSKAWPSAARAADASWSVHRELMGHPDRVKILRSNPRMTVNEARRLIGKQPANYAKPAQPRSHDPQNWTLDQWDDFDAEVVKASRTVLLAFNVRQMGLYTPSVEATAQLALLKQSDLDAELAALLKAAE